MYILLNAKCGCMFHFILLLNLPVMRSEANPSYTCGGHSVCDRSYGLFYKAPLNTSAIC